jgi:hypothetical protein
VTPGLHCRVAAFEERRGMQPADYWTIASGGATPTFGTFGSHPGGIVSWSSFWLLVA